MGFRDLRVWRYALFALLLGVLGLTMIGVLASTRANTEAIMREHVHDEMQRIAMAVTDSTKRFLAPAERVAQLTQKLLETGVLRAGDRAALERYLLGQLQANPEFTGMYLGRPDGGFVFVRRDAGIFTSKFIETGPTARRVEVVTRDAAFLETRREGVTNDSYDPRARPWYRAARQSNMPIWTDPYIFFTGKRPGITSAVAVRDGRGGLVGVVGVDLELGGLSAFLEKLPISQHGSAFIADQHGTAVAVPGLRDSLGVLERPAPLPRVAKIAGRAAHHLIGSDALEGSKDLRAFQVGSVPYFGTLHPLALGHGITWTVGIHAPAADFLGDIQAAYDHQVREIIVIFLIACLIAVPVAFGATHPIVRLHRQATTDELTGLPNRTEFRRQAETLMARARSQSRPVTVAMIDLDGFKAVNDRYGHPAGDDVLAEVGARLSSLAREGLLVGRLGGDEFALLMSGIGVLESHGVAERVRRLIAAEITTKAGVHHLGATIGLASSDATVTVRELLSQADQALVHGKTHDKNRTYRYPAFT